MSARIRAVYLLETAGAPDVVAATIAGEQSSGTFVAVPGETPELKARAGARVEAIEALDSVETPSLPSRVAQSGPWRRYRLSISWPLDNLGPSLPNLLATIAGNLFELQDVTGLRILDIDLPDAFADAYPGPAFGIEGTRRLSGVHGRPLIGTIVKPSVGLGPAETAALVGELAEGGIDFVKDDELQADGPSCPFAARATQVLQRLDAAAQASGRKVMYAANITGDLDEMRRRHDLVAALGGTSVMVSLNAIGLVGLLELRRHARLPIHAHRNGWGYLSRHPLLGWSYVAWQKIWRLAGADHMHVNGLGNKFSEADDSVVESARACLTPLFADKPCLAMPVFSSGQTPAQAAGTYAALGSVDLIHAAGGGILANPRGIRAGVEAMREAWDRAAHGDSPASREAGAP